MKQPKALATEKNAFLTPLKVTRLYRMGLVDARGCPELLGLETLASVCSGCLYDDLNTEIATQLYNEALFALSPAKPQLIYQILVRAYTSIGATVPKPVQLLSDDENCLLYYTFSFLENWRDYLKADGILEA